MRRYKVLSQLIEDNKLCIDVDILGLDEEWVKDYFASSDKLQIAFDLLDSGENNKVLFGVRQVRNFSEILDSSVRAESNISRENFSKLINILLSSEDLRVIFEVSWIFINITKNTGAYNSFFTEETYLRKTFEMLNVVEDFEVKNHLLWIFSNIISDSRDTMDKITSTIEVNSYVFNVLTSSDFNIPNFFKSTAIWYLGKLIRFASEELIAKCIDVFPYILKYLRSSIVKQIFDETLDTVRKFCDIDDPIVAKYLKENSMPETLSEYISQETDQVALKNIFAILASVTYFYDSVTRSLHENGMLMRLESFLAELIQSKQNTKYFKNKDQQLLENLMWLITNVAGCEIEKVRERMIRKTKIPKLLLQILSQTSHKNLILSILEVFVAALHSKSDILKTELLRIKIPEVFFEHLENPEESIQFKSLQGIKFFLHFGEKIMSERNIVKLALDMMGLGTTLENMENSNNPQLAELSKNILKGYFYTGEVEGH